MSAVSTATIVSDRRLDRVTVGAADRQPRPGGRGRARALCGGMTARLWLLAAAVFLAAALLTRRPRRAGATSGCSTRVESVVARAAVRALSRSPLSPTEESIFWHIRLPRVVLGALVGAMLSVAGRVLPGRVPEPARRPVPARRRRRRGPRRDDRVRLPAAAASGPRRAAAAAFLGAASPSLSPTRSAARPARRGGGARWCSPA